MAIESQPTWPLKTQTISGVATSTAPPLPWGRSRPQAPCPVSPVFLPPNVYEEKAWKDAVGEEEEDDDEELLIPALPWELR